MGPCVTEGATALCAVVGVGWVGPCRVLRLLVDLDSLAFAALTLS